MRLADYVMQCLKQNDVKHIFMLSGGGIMYLVDALGRSEIDYVCCHHEQAAGIAAQAYTASRRANERMVQNGKAARQRIVH
jgi:acetolactate synthase-1/2/3 large subunit